MKRIIAEDNPTLLGADEQKFSAALYYEERDLEEELTIIEATRGQMARILRKLPESAWSRAGTHNERGRLTLEQMMGYGINHIPHHLKFIHEKRAALGVPQL
jgi:DinB superfamily